jgi:hypothetical protein
MLEILSKVYVSKHIFRYFGTHLQAENQTMNKKERKDPMQLAERR